jgi:hypothetical protein
MIKYKVLTKKYIGDKTFGDIMTENDLVGNDVSNLLKTGLIEAIEVAEKPATKEKESD